MSDTMTLREFEAFEQATAIDSAGNYISTSDSAVRAIADSILHSQASHSLPVSEPQLPPGTIAAVVTVSVLVLSGLAYYIYIKVYWERGIFPPRMFNRRSNRYDALLNLGFNILRCDSDERVEKHRMLRHFLDHWFPEKRQDWNDAYQLAQTLSVTTESVAAWLRDKLTAAEKREVLQMLFEIAVLDGVMGQREHANLLAFVKHVGIDEAVLAAMVADQRRDRAERLHEQQQRSRPVAAPASEKRRKALERLSLSDGFTQKELKNAYRALAKRFHPDKFQHASETDQQHAHAQFVEIQEAYELLLEA